MEKHILFYHAKAMQTAIEKGFKPKSDIFEDNIEEAMAYLLAHRPAQIPLIHSMQSINSQGHQLEYELPISGHNAFLGEVNYNPIKERYEHVDQDVDGRCYLIIAKF